MSDQAEILNSLIKTKDNIFLTGKAGTGKSYVINQFYEASNNIVKLATTGIAAYNIQGQTIHSFFGLKPSDTIKTLKYQKRINDVVSSIRTIIIDEVSMLRPDLLDLIDATLKMYSKNKILKKMPFAGVRIILVGDLYQLEPVMNDGECKILGYDSKYFFNAKIFKKANFITHELDKIYRQSDDVFIKILNKIRTGEVENCELNNINSLFKLTEHDAITLTTTNNKAKEINQKYLDSNNNYLLTRNAKIDGDFNINNVLAQEKLDIKSGCKVMILVNGNCKTTGNRFYNGSIGIFESYYHQEGIECSRILLNGYSVFVSQYTWNNYKYINKDGKIELQSVGTFTQHPIKLAYAVTIHKSQGLTFDKINVDLGDKVFAKGQLYTALSRAKTMQGINLSRKISPNDVQVNLTVNNFLLNNEIT